MATRAQVPDRKPRDAYHHGNLRQALVDEAVRTIKRGGVDALTLREVGAALQVSRTALYRHFADKDALLAAVATEGFRAFRVALTEAWEGGGRGRAGFIAQGEAYLRFAVENSSHYRVMFGGFVDKSAEGTELAGESEAGFRVLVDAIVELQQTGVVRPGEPLDQALFAWATVHGAALLAISNLLEPGGCASIDAVRGVIPRIVDALEIRESAKVPAPGRVAARPPSRTSGGRSRSRT